MANSANRLRIFIDGGYLFNAFKKYRDSGYRYSSSRLIRRLGENRNLLKVHYVNSINMRDPSIKEKQERFYYGQLRDKLGWDVQILQLQFPGGKGKQKGVDATLAVTLHHLGFTDEFDTAILIAADSDFCTTVNFVKGRGKIVHNAFFKSSPSYHLTRACNGANILLDEIDFVYHKDDPKTLLKLSTVRP